MWFTCSAWFPESSGSQRQQVHSRGSMLPPCLHFSSFLCSRQVFHRRGQGSTERGPVCGGERHRLPLLQAHLNRVLWGAQGKQPSHLRAFKRCSGAFKRCSPQPHRGRSLCRFCGSGPKGQGLVLRQMPWLWETAWGGGWWGLARSREEAHGYGLTTHTIAEAQPSPWKPLGLPLTVPVPLQKRSIE